MSISSRRRAKRCMAVIVRVCVANRWIREGRTEVDRAIARRSGARAGWQADGQGTCRNVDRSIDRASAIQTTLRNDVSGLSPRAPTGSRLARGTARRSRRVKRATAAATIPAVGFATRSREFLAIRQRKRKKQGGLFAERIETPLGSMLAIADDEGLRLLEFVDRRSLERELSILRTRLQTNVVPGEHRHLRCDSRTTGRLFLRQESRVRRSARAGRFALSTSRLGTASLDSDRRDALLFLDGEKTG